MMENLPSNILHVDVGAISSMMKSGSWMQSEMAFSGHGHKATQQKTKKLPGEMSPSLYIRAETLTKVKFCKNQKKRNMAPKFKVTKHFESFKRKMLNLGIFPLGGCFFDGCRDHTQASGGFGTRIWNLSDRPVELQIRVGSILKKVHTLKPGSSKRLKCKSIYKAYMPGFSGSGIGGGGMKSLLYYYDEACQPYIWVHDTGGDFTRMVKQQYISLEDMRSYSEIRIFRDHQRGCISVRKKPRPDFC